MPPVTQPQPKSAPAGFVIRPGIDPEKLITANFEHAKSYSQVVLGFGYAAIFATWAFTKDQLTPREELWSAFLAAISVFAYVLVEVVNTIIMSVALAKAGLQKTPAAAAAALQAQQVRPGIYFVTFGVAWLVSFLTGVASAVILIRAFVLRLFF